jgi:hypothetical protein
MPASATRLCANANSRTDFRGIQESYRQRQDGCIFCALEGGGRVLLENELALCIADACAVTPGHSLEKRQPILIKQDQS